VGYVSDIFSQLNIMNQSLQGPNIMLVNVSEKLLAFMEKLKLWKRNIVSEKRNISCFYSVSGRHRRDLF